MTIPEPTDDQLTERRLLLRLLRQAETLEEELRVLDHTGEAVSLITGVITPLQDKIRPINDAIQAWAEDV